MRPGITALLSRPDVAGYPHWGRATGGVVGELQPEELSVGNGPILTP